MNEGRVEVRAEGDGREGETDGEFHSVAASLADGEREVWTSLWNKPRGEKVQDVRRSLLSEGTKRRNANHLGIELSIRV